MNSMQTEKFLKFIRIAIPKNRIDKRQSEWRKRRKNLLLREKQGYKFESCTKSYLMKNKICMFDADGVVIQSQMFSHKYAQEFNINISELDNFFKTDFQECLVGKSDLKIAIKPWLKKWDWSKSIDEFLVYWFEAEHNINSDLIKHIRELRKNKIKCVLATNQEKYRLEYMKKKMDFETIFDRIYSSNIIGYKKPDIAYYRYILDDLNENPSDITFYDDRQENVESAKLLGINSYLYNTNLKLIME